MIGVLLTIIILMCLPIVLWQIFKFAVKCVLMLVFAAVSVLLQICSNIFRAIRMF